MLSNVFNSLELIVVLLYIIIIIIHIKVYIN